MAKFSKKLLNLNKIHFGNRNKTKTQQTSKLNIYGVENNVGFIISNIIKYSVFEKELTSLNVTLNLYIK